MSNYESPLVTLVSYRAHYLHKKGSLCDRKGSAEAFDSTIKFVCGRRTRGTQREYSSKTLKHSSVKRILLFKR